MDGEYGVQLRIPYLELSELNHTHGVDSHIEIRQHIRNLLLSAGFDLNKPFETHNDMKSGCYVYRQRKIVTNREYFFGEKLLNDTIMLLTYDNHPRAECRLFKKLLKESSAHELEAWLDSPKDKRFTW